MTYLSTVLSQLQPWPCNNDIRCMSINANEICYDLHYDYSSHNDTNFTVRRFLEKSNEFIDGKLVQHSMSMIVVKLFCFRSFSLQHFNDFFFHFYSQGLLEKSNEFINGKNLYNIQCQWLLSNCFVLGRFHCNILTCFFFQFYSQETLGVRGQPRQYKRGWSHCFASGKLQLMNIIINRYNYFQLIIQLIIQLQCCIDDSEEMMKLLIQYGGNPNATDTEKWTPLVGF